MFTGPKHSGKTESVQRIAEKLKKENFKIAGFTAPSVYEGAFLLGFDLVDINSGKRVKFARRKPAAERFQFSEKGFEFGRKILRNPDVENADLIIIDEFGPMELHGGGWRDDVDRLLEKNLCLLMVVREDLIEDVKILYADLPCRLFSAEQQSFEKIKHVLNKR